MDGRSAMGRKRSKASRPKADSPNVRIGGLADVGFSIRRHEALRAACAGRQQWRAEPGGLLALFGERSGSRHRHGLGADPIAKSMERLRERVPFPVSCPQLGEIAIDLQTLVLAQDLRRGVSGDVEPEVEFAA